MVDAAALVCIARHSLGADTLVSALLVDALSTIGAWSIGALVGADATLEWVALEASFAHALRWISGTAFGVDSA